MAEAHIPINELIRRASAGDQSSLESLLLHFHDPLLHFVRTALPAVSGVAPEDALQETFFTAFRSIHGLEARGGDAFFAWLKKIARNRVINLIEAEKAKKRGGGRARASSGADAAATSILQRIAGPGPTPSLILRRKEIVTEITRAVAKLDPERRQIIELRYGKGLSNLEVAEKVQKSEGAVKMILNRTIKELRAMLAEDFGDFTSVP